MEAVRRVGFFEIWFMTHVLPASRHQQLHCVNGDRLTGKF